MSDPDICASKVVAHPVYERHRVPAGLLTGAQLRELGLAPPQWDPTELAGWLVEFTETGGVRHVPLYGLDMAKPAAPGRKGEGISYYSNEIWDGSGWALHAGTFVGLVTTPCCGRISQAATARAQKGVLFESRVAAPPGATCTHCATGGGKDVDSFRKEFGRALQKKHNPVPVVWGLADALVLERFFADRARGPLRAYDLFDAQQGDAWMRGSAAWEEGAGYAYSALPSHLDARARCEVVLARLRDYRERGFRERRSPVDEPIGPPVDYGVLTLPRELALLVPQHDGPARRTIAAPPQPARPRVRHIDLEQQKVEQSTWLHPEDERVLKREESSLVTALAGYLEHRLGHVVSRHEVFPGSGARLYTDCHDVTCGVVYEAKASAARGHVRMAVGQLLEYQFYLEEAGDGVSRLAMLLPSLPGPDLLRWLGHQGIWVAYPDDDGGFRTWPDSTIFDPEKKQP